MRDVFDMAVTCLRPGGRLVYLHPFPTVLSQEQLESVVPAHPCLARMFVANQGLSGSSGMYCRCIVAMEKVWVCVCPCRFRWDWGPGVRVRGGNAVPFVCVWGVCVCVRVCSLACVLGCACTCDLGLCVCRNPWRLVVGPAGVRA
jgi:hypothetical protein